jgi:Asp-tRNA(Asn)/Glu-tRNA(Gln) amidotransferase A subunit family amidase
VRTLVKKSFEDALKKYDVLISPAAPSAAYKIGMLLSAHVFSSSPKKK